MPPVVVLRLHIFSSFCVSSVLIVVPSQREHCCCVTEAFDVLKKSWYPFLGRSLSRAYKSVANVDEAHKARVATRRRERIPNLHIDALLVWLQRGKATKERLEKRIFEHAIYQQHGIRAHFEMK